MDAVRIYRGIDEDSVVFEFGRLYIALCTGHPRLWWFGIPGPSQNTKWHISVGVVGFGWLG